MIDSDLVVRVGVVVCGRGGGWLRKLMVGEKNSLLVIVVEKLSIWLVLFVGLLRNMLCSICLVIVGVCEYLMK